MRNFVLGVAAALVVLPAGMLGYFALGFSQLRSDVKPSALESRIMQSAVRAAARRSASGIPHRAPADNDELVAGGKLYVAGCDGCHGSLGKPFREDLHAFPPTPQLPQVGTQYSEPEIYWIVKHGIRMSSMSAYGPFYSEKQLWALAGFLHRIKNLPPGVLEAIQTKEKK